jgi:phenylacetate-coenzyme A ligase PaaK-like adenylate-forming protein
MISTDEIFAINDDLSFEKIALSLFEFHFDKNPVYRTYCEHIGINKNNVDVIERIPFLPIHAFKSHKIIVDDYFPEKIFLSSGTTNAENLSKHYVADLKIYEKSYQKGFQKFYGNIEDYTVLALLPSYLERSGSSLIYMANDFINQSKNAQSAFYLNEYDKLAEVLIDLNTNNTKTLLIGVSYALLDFAEKYRLKLNDNITIMETGGMKGRRKEMIRAELHQILSDSFGVKNIHSEYGMTELLSQAYSKGNGVFQCPPWMKFLIRESDDPLSYCENGKTGGINIIDLANIYSCPFIATQDLGKKLDSNNFEILGRFDNSDVRGCNLMFSN